MRQRRKSFIVQPIKWALLIGVVGAGTVYGLSAAGIIEWNASTNLNTIMFWKSNDKLAVAVASNATIASKPTAASKQGEAPSAAPTAAATPAPSAAPAASPTPAQTAGMQVLSQAQSKVAANANEKVWLEQVGLIKLEPGKLFSFQAWLEEAVKGKAPEPKSDELSHVAGLLYEAAVRAGMHVGERYPHQDNPSYASSGFDVDFQKDSRDLTFYNSLGFPVTVGIVYNGDSPIVTMNGKPKAEWKAPKITVSSEIFAPETIVLTDFSLVGQGDVKRSEGLQGLLVKVFADKNDGKNELLYKDFYAPHPVMMAKAPSAEELKAP
ncbi:VanW family protein [Paenibacillus oryzisoli]|uniref:VanW family protein n=1 Tax=Paenibacillus oryzisoli TaxID=1850517 RepID=UPI003D270D79